ncbi:hypothetical protein GCM10022416_19280 [Actinomadura keratinilytica]|uniref:Uncharacterized protein n=1 Tax=Actinomadura keratinilytica TaxID=547461 RepID=A0ABP7YGP7_9ACTN
MPTTFGTRIFGVGDGDDLDGVGGGESLGDVLGSVDAGASLVDVSDAATAFGLDVGSGALASPMPPTQPTARPPTAHTTHSRNTMAP